MEFEHGHLGFGINRSTSICAPHILESSFIQHPLDGVVHGKVALSDHIQILHLAQRQILVVEMPRALFGASEQHADVSCKVDDDAHS